MSIAPSMSHAGLATGQHAGLATGQHCDPTNMCHHKWFVVPYMVFELP
jgi:hypothetical protein